MKISQVLIDSDKTRTQTTGNLVRSWDTDGKPENYCALGALACEKDMINSINDMRDIKYEEILMSYGIKNAFVSVEMPRKSMFDKGEQGKIGLLSRVICNLNDYYRWSFKQIGEFLKKLEDKGIILYND